MSIPYVDGILSAEQVSDTAASIAAMQEPCGAVPWTVGEHVDMWNHVEAAMAMLVGGEVEAAERAYAWMPGLQRADGSFPMKIVGGVPEDERGDVNMTAYLAVGVWHNWLVRSDVDFLRRHWPAVRRALDWVVSMQLPFGGIAWSQEWHDGRPGPVNEDALLAGSSSIYHSLRSGVALAELVGSRRWSGSSRAAASATRCASTATCSWTSRRSRWTGTTRSSEERCAGRPGSTCWPRAGTTSWCRASASAASTPIPG